MTSEDIFFFSENLYAILPDWPAMSVQGVSLLRLDHAGAALDTFCQQARSLGYAAPSTWPVTRVPVGLLFREPGVQALLSWLRGLVERVRSTDPSDASLFQLERVRAMVERAAVMNAPLLRLLDDNDDDDTKPIFALVSARKAHVFWDSESVERTCDMLPDISPLWPALEGPAAPRSAKARSALAIERARACERRIRELEVAEDETQLAKLASLLADEAHQDPTPVPEDVLPSRTAVLWRPHRLELVDVERWVRCLRRHDTRNPAMTASMAFFESASAERANVLLDAICTDSLELPR